LKLQPISSSSNSLLKRIRGLHQRATREKTGQFIVEGIKSVEEALQHKVKVTDIAISQTCLRDGPPSAIAAFEGGLSVVDDKLFKDLGTTITPCGVIAVVRMPEYKAEELLDATVPLLVIAHAVQDPGNLGTIIRTARAAGASGVILTKGTVDPFSPKVVRSAMGALFTMPMLGDIELPKAVAMLKERNIRICGLDMEADKHYFDADLRGPTALVLGNEGHGFDKEELELMDEVLSIPMDSRSESLNVSASAAIVLFSAVEQRMKAR
jgi:RNA methyltransferase, TrmH family